MPALAPSRGGQLAQGRYAGDPRIMRKAHRRPSLTAEQRALLEAFAAPPAALYLSYIQPTPITLQ
jgi:hypothetical protein